jgi:uncharacterized protein with HEPN domain
MRKKRSIKVYVDDMIQSIDRILEYVEVMDYDSFKKDQKTIDAVIRNFEIIGEASKNIPLIIRGGGASVLSTQ